MDLSTFLKQIQESPVQGASVLSFKVSHYSPVFFSYLFNYLKLLKAQPILSLSVIDNSFDQIRAQLEISFLHSSHNYWLKDVIHLDKATKQKLLQYIAAYQGPHSLIFVDSPEDKNNYNYTVEIPDIINSNLYHQLYLLFYKNPCDTSFVRQAFAQQDLLPLDSACLLMAYQATLGKNTEAFFATWFNKLVVKDISLFTLSQYLFAQQQREFFDYWSTHNTNYPPEFWVSFWSEQLWQALLFITHADTMGIIYAKQKASRLPFSFINKDWRFYTIDFLVQAHDALYLIDYQLKNGGGTYDLDLWYHLFFLKKTT